MKTYICTGGAGCLGSAVVKALVARGDKVYVVDNLSRGNCSRLKDVAIEDRSTWDIANTSKAYPFCEMIDCVIHMAAINGTKNFYERPDEVLHVSIQGMLNVLNLCKLFCIPELLFVSSSEVYQEAPTIPTPEDVPLVVPDLFNPRYSYGGGKIAAELLAVHCGQFLKRMMIVRPHNVVTPDMPPDHVLPSFVHKMLHFEKTGEVPNLYIQGTGLETRAFCDIEDFTSALLCVLDYGENRNVYNIGNPKETNIWTLAHWIGKHFSFCIPLQIMESVIQKGSPKRRCPDITKLKSLGWKGPIISLERTIENVVQWHRENGNESKGESQTTAEAK